MSTHRPTGYRDLRKGRRSIPDQIYLITTVCQKRKAHFLSWATASKTCAALGEQRIWRDSQPLAWVLMPDHLHVLIQLGSSETLSHLMQRVKAVTACAANHPLDEKIGTIWMPGYHERAIRRDQDVLSAARYIVGNPIRSNLVDKVGQYPYWDAVWIDGTSAGGTVLDGCSGKPWVVA